MNGILSFIVIIFIIIQFDMDCVKIPKIGSILVFIGLLLREFIRLIGEGMAERKNQRDFGMIKNVGCVSVA
jgi:hypothetical protein